MRKTSWEEVAWDATGIYLAVGTTSRSLPTQTTLQFYMPGKLSSKQELKSQDILLFGTVFLYLDMLQFVKYQHSGEQQGRSVFSLCLRYSHSDFWLWSCLSNFASCQLLHTLRYMIFLESIQLNDFKSLTDGCLAQWSSSPSSLTSSFSRNQFLTSISTV